MTVADYTSKIKDMTMLLVEENHASASRVCTLIARCFTLGRIGPVVVVDEAADKSKIEGIIVMSIVVPNPPEVGGIKAAL